MSTGPHTLAVMQTLEEMRRRYAEMEPPARTADKHSRAITMALHEAVMPLLAADRDAGGGPAADEAFAQGACHALGNFIASLASSFVAAAEGQPLISQTNQFCQVISHRAMLRAMDPGRGVVVWHGEPAPAESKDERL